VLEDQLDEFDEQGLVEHLQHARTLARWPSQPAAARPASRSSWGLVHPCMAFRLAPAPDRLARQFVWRVRHAKPKAWSAGVLCSDPAALDHPGVPTQVANSGYPMCAWLFIVAGVHGVGSRDQNGTEREVK
jgi:hypothetical protein